MIPEPSPCFPNVSQEIHHPNQLFPDVVATSTGGGVDGSETQLGSLLCSLSILKDKVHNVQSLVSIFLSSENHQGQPALASMGTLIQEIIVTASSMMFNCQQMALAGSPQGSHHNNDDDNNNNNHHHHPVLNSEGALSQLSTGGATASSNQQGFFEGESFYNWYSTDNTAACTNSINNTITATTTTTTTSTRADSCRTTTTTTTSNSTKTQAKKMINNIGSNKQHQQGYDIVELDAADLLAKYTHYCQVCGKGFKRDANLRMHMRAHGDEYKSPTALSNPLKSNNNSGESNGGGNGEISTRQLPRKYSCPQEGCRWNKNHAKFQPLKSMICVKNHYKRSHCPKMYVCKRCNRKQFSVLSDLRTHEKHCGDLKWQCSCGTTFSRKDKLMGHVALFVGHTPLINPLGNGSFSSAHKHFEHEAHDHHQGMQIQFQDR